MIYQLKHIEIHWKYTDKTWFSIENTMKITTYRQPGDRLLRSEGSERLGGQTNPSTTFSDPFLPNQSFHDITNNKPFQDGMECNTIVKTLPKHYSTLVKVNMLG